MRHAKISARVRRSRPIRRFRKGSIVVKVIASDVRKGNVIEHDDGKLYVVLTQETFRPGKGTPTSTLVMRRIVDGVKTTQTYKTSDALEKAFVEEIKHNFLFQDGENYVFMNPESFEQVTVTGEMVGEQAVYLAENMECYLTMYQGEALAVSLPSKVVLEIMETEPVVKGQTASSSYKPAKLSNGAKTMVPPHIDAGTRVVINTEDGSYVERSKD
jgi:elongation factor P